MKKTLFLFLALMTFGLMNTSYGQHQLKNKEIIFTLPVHETATIVPVDGMDLTFKFNHRAGQINTFEAATCNADRVQVYDLCDPIFRAQPNGRKDDVFNGTVKDHPSGPFTLNIKYLDPNETAQENRRVEIKIVFN